MISNRPLLKTEETPFCISDGSFDLCHGDILIAAITSCTNTSNPSVLIAAGLLAKKAVEKGLTVQRHIKTSLAPGSRVVTEYLTATGLLPYLEQLGFHLAGYGCTTCIGNAGPLSPPEPRQEYPPSGHHGHHAFSVNTSHQPEWPYDQQPRSWASAAAAFPLLSARFRKRYQSRRSPAKHASAPYLTPGADK
ncbi:hypothetical protein B566_EDAN019242 [Ephemera danica]|nr:hypothetical protein B566_EDAN019242 [Ephemera danica]